MDDELTAYENLELHAVLYGVDKKTMRQRIEELMTLVELWDRKDSRVKTFSGGMKRRLEIARGLLHHPKVLFLDEPFEGIDPVSARNIKDLLLVMVGKGITVFLTSHILEVVERLVQSFAIIVGGEIVCSQTMEATLRSGDTLEDLFFKHVVRETAEELEWIG